MRSGPRPGHRRRADDVTSADTPPSRSRVRWWVMTATPLVVAAYAVGLVVVGGQQARQAVAAASPVALVAALGLQVLVILIWPNVHRASLRAVGERVSYPKALNASMSAFTVSHSVPGGGAVGAAVAVDRFVAAGVPGPVATAAATLTSSILLTTIAGLGAVGIGAAVLAGELPLVVLVLAGVVLAGLVALVATIVRVTRSATAGERVIDALARIPRLREHAEKWKRSWGAVDDRAATPRALATVVGWSCAKWTADLGSLALVFLAFGQTPRLSTLLVGFAAAQVLGAIPISPGGVGFVESGMVGAFTVLGIGLGQATTLVLAYRVLETWLPVVAGIPALVRRPRP